MPAPVATASEPWRAIQRVGAALEYRDFRVFWIAVLTSGVGTWMQEVSMNWLIVTLTGATSAFYLGLDTFLGEAPVVLLIAVGGVVADRWDRRKVLIVSQLVQMFAAFGLALLAYTGRVRVWHVLILTTAVGVIRAFGTPAYVALLPTLVETEHVPNAIALNSIQYNIGRFIGPLLAGVALAAWGMAACFGLNGASFVAVIAALLTIRRRPVAMRRESDIKAALTSGFRFVRENSATSALIILAFATTFLANPFLTLLPLFVRDVFHGGVVQYTRMMTCAGGGAVAGALLVAWLGRFRGMGTAVLLAQIGLGIVLTSFAQVRSSWLMMPLLFISGVGLIVVYSMMSSMMQLIAPNEIRGRVMSIYMVPYLAGMPLGSLLSGWMAMETSPRTALTIDGVLLTGIAGSFALRSHGLKDF